MRLKATIALALIVLLPVALLGWWGMQMARNEQAMHAHQLQALIDSQLESVEGDIAAYFDDVRTLLRADAQTLSVDAAALRDYLDDQPGLRQVFVMAGDGSRIHPPSDLPLSSAEQAFVERTAAIWTDKNLLYESHAAEKEQPAAASSSQIKTSRKSESDATAAGWHVWYAGNNMNWIFWWRDGVGSLIGFELDPVRVAADIIALLPSTGGDYDKLGNASVRLLNEHDSIIYQWGRLQPGAGQQRAGFLPLRHPLGSWKLEYYGAGLQAGSRWSLFNLATTLITVCAALGGLAFFLYREHTRAMRVATQRVSFVNQVSHELKTPLTNIRMYAELLDDQLDELSADPVESRSRLRRYSDVIATESQRLSRLIANVLSFSQSQRGRLQLRAKTDNVDRIIESAVAAYRPALEAKNCEIRIRTNASQPAEIDPDIVEQILNNLLSNVEKYGASGGLLEITSAQEESRITVTVHDHGPGIAKREQQRIFDAFYRIDSRITEGVSGTGMGLSIARQLARLHGGDLTLVATEKGACFRLTLHGPVAKGEAQ
ncbi:MAG: sensor histidine kinase [Gammaproteobacteria bacterium]